MEDLIKWVKRQLIVKKMSQRELARRAGVSNTFISDTLKGDSPVTWGFCKAISKGLNEPFWNVLIMAGKLDEIPKDLIDDEDIRVLVEKYGQLSLPSKVDLQKYLDWLILKDKV